MLKLMSMQKRKCPTNSKPAPKEQLTAYNEGISDSLFQKMYSFTSMRVFLLKQQVVILDFVLKRTVCA